MNCFDLIKFNWTEHCYLFIFEQCPYLLTKTCFHNEQIYVDSKYEYLHFENIII